MLHVLGQLYDVLFLLGHELVQRRIEEADGHGTGPHELAIHGLEVALLIRQDLRKGGLAALDGLGDDHLADRLDTVGLEEHVLGAAQADALGAELDGLRGVARGVGVGADLQLTARVGPAHEAAEVAGDSGFYGRDGLAVDLAGGAVDGDPVAFVVASCRPASKYLSSSCMVISPQPETQQVPMPRATTAAWDVMPPRTVRMPCAASHALDVLGRGLKADKNDFLTALRPFLGVLGGEHDAAAGSAGRGGKTGADDLGSLQRGGVELRVQQSVELFGLDTQDRFVLA